MYRLLALDIDGTLVNSRHELTEPTRAAVRAVRAAGVQVVLATGRRYSRTLPLVEPLGLDLPLITASGALIKHPADHRTLFMAQFDPTVLRAMLSHIERRGYDAILYTDSFAQGFDFHCPTRETNPPELADFYLLNPEDARIHPTLMRDPPDDAFAGFVIGQRPDMLALAAELVGQWPDHLYVHVLRSPRYVGFMCEIAPAGVSKWSGVLHLASEWGIEPAEICAVGDDVNDLPMIVGAGLGVAMANSVPELKLAADRIAPCNDSDGVVEVARWILDSH